MTFGFRFRTITGLALLLLAALLGTSSYSYRQSRQLTEHMLFQLEGAELSILQREIEYQLAEHRNILMALKDVPEVEGVVRAREQRSPDEEMVWKVRLARTFVAFLETHDQTLQLRLIDARGQELVRVEANGAGGARVVPDDELQDKRDSDYVVEGRKLLEGETFTSSVDLNREHGRIQVPHVPVLRLVAPIYDSSGRLDALLVTNVAANELFRGLRGVVDGGWHEVINERGDFIVHPDESLTFGWERGQSHNLGDEDPELLQQALTEERRVSFDARHRRLECFQRVYFAPGDEDRFWVVVAHLPEKVAFGATEVALRRMLFVGTLLGGVLLIPALWFVTSAVVRPVLTLAEAARRMRAGDMTVRVDESRVSGEFRDLYVAINAMAASHQEVTENLEYRVEEQTRRLSAVIHQAADGILTVDERGTVEMANPAAADLFGLTVSQVVGRCANDLLPDSFVPAGGGLLRPRHRSDDHRAVQDCSAVGADGGPLELEFAVGEYELDDRRHFVVIVRDVSVRRGAERVLQTYARRLELAAKAVAMGVWEYRIAPNELIWDERMFQLYGRPAGEFEGAYSAWERALHPEDRARAERELDEAIAGGSPFDTTFRVVWPSGEERVIRAAATVERDERGVPQRMIGVNWDITEQSQVEKLRQEFVSTVSHELRTPLTSIRGALGLVLGGVLGEVPPKVGELLAIANKNSERLILLINDILDLEKLSSGSIRLDIHRHDLRALVDHAVEDNRAYASPLGVALVIEGEAGEPVWVDADETRIAQVLANLISNAAKFSPEGGTVRIGVETVGERARVFVRDQGPGIPAAFHTKIFQKFSQADSSDTRQKGGTGLGLSITKSIVEQHGGSIRFETSAGEGTTFFVDLPLATSEADSRSVANEGVDGWRRGERRCILHVEDDPDVARVAEAVLGEDFYLLHASTLTEARDHLSRRGVDALLIDIALPDGSGLDLLGIAPDLPAVLFTAQDVSADVAERVAGVLVKSRTKNADLLELFHGLFR